MTSNTFRELEKKFDIKHIYSGNESLPQWYNDNRDTPLSELSVGDICICLRQDLFVDTIIQFAINMILKDPLAGDIYDGELIAAINSLKQIPDNVDSEVMSSIVDVLSLCRNDADNEIKIEIDKLITKLSS